MTFCLAGVVARADTIVGGAFATATAHDVDSSGFAYAYVYDLLNADIQPPVFSLHPYHDLQNSWACVQTGAGGCSTTETSNLVNMLDAAYAGNGAPAPQIWLTEAGVWLNGALYGAQQRLSSSPAAETTRSRAPPTPATATSRRHVATGPMRRRVGDLRIALASNSHDLVETCTF